LLVLPTNVIPQCQVLQGWQLRQLQQRLQLRTYNMHAEVLQLLHLHPGYWCQAVSTPRLKCQLLQLCWKH
jgi:hypothetical protein